MQETFYAKLRCNVSLQGDVELARRDLEAFFEFVLPAKTAEDVVSQLGIPRKFAESFTRAQPPIGFVCSRPRLSLDELVKKLNFTQELWFTVDGTRAKELPGAPWLVTLKENDGVVGCAIPFMAAAEFLTSLPTRKVYPKDFNTVIHCLTHPQSTYSAQISRAITRMSTSTSHVHGLHKYKAKFFPRMIRSFLVSKLESLPKAADGSMVVVDPFVGSGTTLVEASLLGLTSIGIDIDLLSCAISQAKIDVLSGVDVKELDKAIQQLRTEVGPLFQSTDRKMAEYELPPWMARKFDKWHSPKERSLYQEEISRWRDLISNIEDTGIRRVLLVSLSDAISRKFNVRMLGTGVGRFALEIAETKLSTLMEWNLGAVLQAASSLETLRRVYRLDLGTSSVIHDTATAMPLSDASVSVVLTSPPYLPASSGRENYLIGKSISITALGLMTSKQIQDTEARSVGSMKALGDPDWNGLPAEVAKLYDWLKADPLREIKARPTVVYYKDLKQALLETHRILKPTGLAIYVIGRESVFYRFSTREVLYRVPCDEIFQKIAEGCGFILEDRVDVELDKKNANARPRSRDAYYETVFFLRKEE